MTAMDDQPRFGLLGSLEATVAGQPVTLPGRRVRALLALLVLHANQPVSTDRIITGLWGDQRPKAARESVHYFVHQLRKALPHAPGDRQGMLERHRSSYLLRVPPDSIDVARFRRGVERAGAARGRGDHQAAWELYAEALGLWRGPALDDLAEVPFAVAEIARLTEQRLAACEHQFAAGLELGLHERLVAELDAQVRANPDREELRYLLMLALYRSGRQAEALEVYQDVRVRMAGRTEPGVRLQQLQRAILTQDPTLDLHPLDQAVPSSLSKEVARPDPPPPAATAVARDRAPTSPASPASSNPQPPRPPAHLQPQNPPVEDRTDERKLVTALVVGIITDPYQTGGDPEETRAQTREAMARMAGQIRHYGGVVQTTDLGRLLAVFGAGRAHEDDPERAARAALDVVVAADEAPGVAVRGGVATGEAVVTHTTHGPDQVVGDVVHLAVTLEQNARPGSVLVNTATHQATSRRFRYTQVAPIGPLGLASEMLWQALAPRGRTGAQAHQGPDAPLVERERELTFLGDVLTRFLRHREPQCVTLISEPGLGKSRLVAELARIVDRAPELVGWRVGHARAYGQGALGALVEVVKAEAGVLEDDDGPTAMRKLQEIAAGLFGDQGTQIAASLGQLLGIGGDALPSQPQGLFDDWAEFFAALAEQRPLVLVLEDLQWADDALVEFAGELARRVGPVPLLLLVTGRPEFLERAAGWGRGQANAVTLTLPPLTREGTTELLDALLGDASLQGSSPGAERLPEPTRTALLDAAGGNPLYVEEYVHMLTGQEPGAAPATQSLSMPTSVQQVIAARIDTLPPADKRLLQDAAAIGETCFLGQLAAVSGGDRDKVAGCLRQLERQGFLRRLRISSVAGEVEYAFRHTLIREVAYGQLLRAERADKHQRAAGWIEQLASDPGERVDLLAHHYSRALELARASGRATDVLAERARTTLRMAGDRAARVGSFTAATGAYEAALELWPADDPERPELLVSLGQALVLGEHAGADVLDQARTAALAHGREDLVAEADAHLRWLNLARGDWAAAQRHAGQRLDGPALQPATSPDLSVLASRAVHLNLTDRHAEAIATARQLVTLARRYGQPELEGNGLHVLGTTRILSGDLDGLADCDEGMALMEAHQYALRVFARLGSARALWWFGDLELCAAAVTDGRELAGTTGVAIGHYFDSMQLGLDYVAGRWDTIAATAERVLARHPTHGRARATCLIFRGSVALAREQADAALADTLAALETINPDDTRYRQATLALQGRCLLAAGRREDAAGCLERLLADQRKRPAESCATLDEALLVLDLGCPAEALPDGLAETRWHQAVRALVARDFDRAVDLLTAIGAPVEVAAARVRAAWSPFR